MRIFISSLIQETNTFSPNKTTRMSFERGYIYHGQEIRSRLLQTNTELGGALEVFEDKEVDVEYGHAFWCVAGGCILDQAFYRMCDEILESLQNSKPVDGVLLALHGALVAQTIEDCEGYLLSCIRNILGPDIPIAVTLDYHANITDTMIRNSDVLVGFKTYPHTDFSETGKRAANILLALCNKEYSLKIAARKLPLIIPVENSETGTGLCGSTMDQMIALEQSNTAISASFFCAQPWLDIKDPGASFLAYSTDTTTQVCCKHALTQITDDFWQRKDELYKEYPAIETLLNPRKRFFKPTILVDSGDVITAGAVGDSTHMLRALTGYQKRSVLCVVCPSAIEQAIAIGEGNEGCITIGTSEEGYNKNVAVQATVMHLSNSISTIHGKSFEGVEVNAGRRAYITIGKNTHVILVEFGSLMHDPQFLLEMGVDIRSMDFIVQKSHKLFRPAYQDIAKEIIVVDTPGFTDMNINRLQFSNVNRPIYPLDKGIRNIQQTGVEK